MIMESEFLEEQRYLKAKKELKILKGFTFICLYT